MHVGYVLKKFPRISETFILNEILQLQRQSVRVTVFSLLPPNDGLFHAGLSELVEPVIYLPPRKPTQLLERWRDLVPSVRPHVAGLWREFESMLLAGRTDVWSVMAWGIEIAAQARQRGIEHLHAHFATVAAHTARVARAAGGPRFSFTCHAKDVYREGVDAAQFAALVEAASTVVTVCQANAAHIEQSLAPASSTPIRTLYNGVDLELFHPRQRRVAAPPLVLGVGRLVEKKGFRFLVDAMAELRRAGHASRCVVVGEGEERAALEARIRDTGAPVELRGLAAQDEVRALMSRATALALPCVIGADGNRDALPTVLLEALAMGLPAVSTPVAGVEEIFDGGECGVLVPCGDSGALASALRELVDNPDRQAQLAAAGRRRAEVEFDLGHNVETLRSLFATAGVERCGTETA